MHTEYKHTIQVSVCLTHIYSEQFYVIYFQEFKTRSFLAHYRIPEGLPVLKTKSSTVEAKYSKTVFLETLPNIFEYAVNQAKKVSVLQTKREIGIFILTWFVYLQVFYYLITIYPVLVLHHKILHPYFGYILHNVVPLV